MSISPADFKKQDEQKIAELEFQQFLASLPNAEQWLKENTGPIAGATVGLVGGPAGSIYGAGAGRFLQNIAEGKSGIGPNGLLQDVPTDVALTAIGEGAVKLAPKVVNLLREKPSTKPVIDNVFSDEKGEPIQLLHGTGEAYEHYDPKKAALIADLKSSGGDVLQTNTIYSTNDPKWSNRWAGTGEGANVRGYAMSADKTLNMEDTMSQEVLDELLNKGYIRQEEVDRLKRVARDREITILVDEYINRRGFKPNDKDLIEIKKQAWQKVKDTIPLKFHDLFSILPKRTYDEGLKAGTPIISIPDFMRQFGYDSAKYLRSPNVNPNSWTVSPFGINQMHEGFFRSPEGGPIVPFWQTSQDVAEQVGRNQQIEDLGKNAGQLSRYLVHGLRGQK